MSKRLRDLIREVRQCRTAASEREAVAKESAAIRDSFTKNEVHYRQRNVAKLLYIHMLGYPTKFGQMEPLKLLSSAEYSDKRVGYLGMQLLLDETQEVLMLATNSVKTDLNHPNPFVVGLALCSLANICNSGMARDVCPDVTKLLSSTNPYIRKKAALCAIRIIRKVPELLEYFVPKIRELLNTKHHGVLLTGITLLIEMCRVERKTVVKVFRPLVSFLVRTMKSLIATGYVVDYDVGGVTDPFLQVRILQLLRILGKGSTKASDQMNDLLAQVATNTEGSRNVGTAILYECVQTIMSIESESGLRVLAINLLGRFLLNRDNNIRYVALSTLSKFVAKDVRAVQEHRQMIVDCLKDADISIRRRALDLVYLLVNTKNVRMLVRELLNFLMNADVEFRADLTAKICYVTEKYAPSKKWHIDTILRVMAIAGGHISDEIMSNLVNLIVSNPELQSYAVQKMYLALNKDLMKQPLVQVGIWCVGEFGDVLVQRQQADVDGAKKSSSEPLDVSEKDIVSLLHAVLRHPSTTDNTKEYVLTAAVKLIDRLPTPSMRAATVKILDEFSTSVSIELQQRACEYRLLLNKFEQDQPSLAKLFFKVPPIAVDEDDVPVASSPASSSSSSSSAAAPRVAAVAAAPATAPVNPLADIFGPAAPAGGAPAAAAGGLLGLGGAAAAPIANNAGGAGANPLASIFGGAPSPAPAPPPVVVAAAAVAVPATPVAAASLAAAPVLAPQNKIHPGLPGSTEEFVAYSSNGVKIVFRFVKKPEVPHLTLINALVTNSTASPLTNFALLVAVPKFIKLAMDAPSGTHLPSNGGRVTQVIKLNNSLHGQKPLLLKLKVSFTTQGRNVADMAEPLSISL
jgi:AP-1 complex subunit gamma-1